MIDLHDGLAEEYLAECGDRLAAIETDLLAIEKGEKDEHELVNRIFHAVHSVGLAGLFGLTAIRDLAHQMEAVLIPVRARKASLTPPRVSALLRATDRLRELVQNPDSSNQADSDEILAALANIEGIPPLWQEKYDWDGAEYEQEEHRLRVLLVEDDFASRLLLQTFLSRHGECHVAVNGKEAVEAFRASLERGQSYDLICMDIVMPEMDGREAVRQVRAVEEAHGVLPTAGAKIIMTTAMHDFSEVIQCFQDLCDAYLTKPINLAKLLRQMRTWELIK
jgi:two-component system chemotaxis response regulator CheY